MQTADAHRRAPSNRDQVRDVCCFMRGGRSDLRAGLELVLLAVLFALSACSRAPPQLGIADYTSLQLRKSCSPGARLGSTGGVDRISAGHDISVSVRTPINYDATLAHPLLVVFAPGGYHRIASEDFYGLTREATTAGFIVAYPDHPRLSMQAFRTTRSSAGVGGGHVVRRFGPDLFRRPFRWRHHLCRTGLPGHI